MIRPTEAQQLAIQAKLNQILGAEDYDRMFLEFRIEDIEGEMLHAFARSEYQASQIESRYGRHVAIAVESVIGRPITQVTVRAKRLAG